jgi:hypothetical protein
MDDEPRRGGISCLSAHCCSGCSSSAWFWSCWRYDDDHRNRQPHPGSPADPDPLAAAHLAERPQRPGDVLRPRPHGTGGGQPGHGPDRLPGRRGVEPGRRPGAGCLAGVGRRHDPRALSGRRLRQREHYADREAQGYVVEVDAQTARAQGFYGVGPVGVVVHFEEGKETRE